MSKITKRIIFGLLSLIVIFILVMTWFYPYSFFSVYKSYTYTPDSYVVDGYVKRLTNFKDSYDENSKDNITAVQTPSVLQLYEQDWLVNKDSVRMTEDDIDMMLFRVKGVRETLLNLTIQEGYTSDQRPYLLDCIKNSLSFEEYLVEMKNDKFVSRSTLNTSYNNLYGAFEGSLMLFVVFYEVSQTK